MLTKYWDSPYRSSYTKSTASPYNNSYRLGQQHTGKNMADDIYDIYNRYQPAVVFVSNPDDKHPDHAALYQYVDMAIQKSGFKPKLYTYLVHYDYFPDPYGLKKGYYLSPPLKLVDLSDGWKKLDLGSELEDLKQIALSKYISQIKVPFLNKLLMSFVRKNELFRQMY